MNVAKIQLSQEELLLVQNADVLLTKNRIIKKVYELFGSMVPGIQNLLEKNLSIPSAVVMSSPKISKGENYLGLPYVMLDYPRCFGKNDIFAIRTMFWWGNFFSITLHLRGMYKKDLFSAIQNNLSLFGKNHFFISINEDEWRHDFMDDNYLSIEKGDELIVRRSLLEKDFCKLAGKIGLEHWNDVSEQLLRLCEVMLQGIDINFRDGETSL